VIVAEASKVTIYDGDDPSLPMWMVFNTGGYNSSNTMLNREGNPQTSVTALNGFVSVGTLQANNVAGGLRRISFIEDVGVNFTETTSANTGTYLGDISERNDQLGFDGVVVGSVVSRNINDVAMTVLPDAPIDPATGLPVPTIAVATDGGVSVIKDDGNVVDSAWTSDSDNVFFDGNNNLWFTRVSSFFGNFFVSNYAADGFTAQSFPRTYNISLNGGSAFGINAATGLKNSVAAFGGTNEWGITFAAYDPTAFSTKSMVAYTTSSYNTGWMPGDIKGAFLSSTDTASLVGSGELVTNGAFDTDTSGWTANTGFALSVVSQELNVAYTSGSGGLWYVGATQAITTVIGKTYVITFDVTALNGNLGRVRVEDNLGGGQNLNKGSLAVGSYSYTFVATGTTTYVNLGVQSDVTSDATYDNISVKLADADRSVNNNGLIVNGTVTRSAVATGAELVAYSGFSASNYLEQPYNSDLDFGTGDFCVMGWVGLASTSLQNYLSITDKSGGGFGTNGQITMRYSSGWSVVTASGTINSSTASAVGSFTQVAAVRSSGVLYLYINGVAVGSVSSAGSLGATNTASNLVVGGAYVAGIWSSGVSTKLALLRISATAPTPDQIKRIYEDEKVLFQENAACTLYGASDAVTALAHDSDTGLLHVGTSAGRSVFQGLRRVSNTTTAVGTAISASNGLVVEE
jgi:hypothetical protein